MKDLFNYRYLKIKKLITEQSMLSNYTSSGRSLTRESGRDEFIMKFYDRLGECKYILPVSSPYVNIPPIEVMQNPTSESRVKLEDMIANNLMHFEAKSERAPSRAEVRQRNPFDVGRKVDADFNKHFAWELVRTGTGEVYAWALKENTSPDDWHIGADGSAQHACPGFKGMQAKKDVSDKDDNAAVATYELHFFDKSGKETYILPFMPIGEYSFSNDKWNVINSITKKQFKENDHKNKKDPVVSGMKKWLNDAVQTTLDEMIDKSNDLPPTPEDAEYPLKEIDGDFGYAEFELWRNGEPLCHANASANFIKFSNRLQ